jgi:L-lactate dehydrogenase complex protein LldG
MKVSPEKENILKRVRNALSQPVQLPFPNSEGNSSVFKTTQEGLEIQFAEEFSKLQGKFIFCENAAELTENITSLIEVKKWKKVYCCEPSLLAIFNDSTQQIVSDKFPVAEMEASITTCELLVARTGSIVISAAQESGRTIPVFSPVHIVVAYVNQLVFDIKDGLIKLKEKYPEQLPSMISFQTGPSRTADIEKTLVVGVHGPREVYVFLVDQPL